MSLRTHSWRVSMKLFHLEKQIHSNISGWHECPTCGPEAQKSSLWCWSQSWKIEKEKRNKKICRYSFTSCSPDFNHFSLSRKCNNKAHEVTFFQEEIILMFALNPLLLSFSHLGAVNTTLQHLNQCRKLVSKYLAISTWSGQRTTLAFTKSCVSDPN